MQSCQIFQGIPMKTIAILSYLLVESLLDLLVE
jgi:hypothetical protein